LRTQAVLLISNNRDSGAMTWATQNKIPASHISSTTAGSDAAADDLIASTLSMAGADLVIMAGYMRMLGPGNAERIQNRILNVIRHCCPSSAARACMAATCTKRLLASGDTETGVTIHLVDAVYDHGAVVAQARVPVEPGRHHETLAQRTQAREETLYVETLNAFSAARLIWIAVDIEPGRYSH